MSILGPRHIKGMANHTQALAYGHTKNGETTLILPGPDSHSLLNLIVEYGLACMAHGDAVAAGEYDTMVAAREARSAAFEAVLDAVMGPETQDGRTIE